MERRRYLAAGGTALLGALAGCTRRATGWSSLGVGLHNELDRTVGLRLRIAVDGRRAFDREFELDGGTDREVTASLDVPWGATLAVVAKRTGTDARATAEWEATVPLWGGSTCMIEPFVEVTDDELFLDRTCVA